MATVLGLTQLRHLEPDSASYHALRREGLRDWPAPLWELPEADLRHAFGSCRRRLVANLLWQVVRTRAAGDADPDLGRSHRDFWYRPLHPVLLRAGLAGEDSAPPPEEGPGPRPAPSPRRAAPTGDPEPPSAEDRLAATEGRCLEELSLRPALDLLDDPPPAWTRGAGPLDPVYLEYLLTLAALVGEHRLFRYRDLGFEDRRPDLRHLGDRRPEVLVVVEKDSLRRRADALVARFGVSLYVTGGMPPWIGSEFLAEDLRATLGARPATLAFLGDWDPGGWWVPRSLAYQLARYDVAVASVKYLVRPQRFSPEELERFARPLRASTPELRGRLRNWLAQTGGIGGEPRGLHADHLWPVERVVRAFEEEMQG